MFNNRIDNARTLAAAVAIAGSLLAGSAAAMTTDADHEPIRSDRLTTKSGEIYVGGDVGFVRLPNAAAEKAEPRDTTWVGGRVGHADLVGRDRDR